MVQERTYHGDRAATEAERARRYRERRAKRDGVQPSVTGKRDGVQPSVTGKRDGVQPSVTGKRDVIVPSAAPAANSVGGGRSPVWPAEDGRTVVRLERAARRTLGPDAKFKDVAEHMRPHLPNGIARNISWQTLYNGWRKAVSSLPPWYDRCVSLMRSWGGYRYDAKPDGPYEFIDEFITIAGPFAFQIPERFERLEKQTGDGSAKHKRAEKLFEKIRKNPADWGVRPKPAYRSDEISAAILSFMNAHPKHRVLLGWSVSDLASQNFARERGISIKAMTHHVKRMRDRQPPELEWADIGQCLVRPAGTGGPVRKPRTTLGLEKLFELPDHKMEVYALTDAVGAASLMWVNTLRTNGLVECPDLRRGTMVELTSKALTIMTARQTIRDGRGAPLWEPAATPTKHRQS